MRRLATILGGLLVLVGALLGMAHMHGRAMQRAAMYNARLNLERAYAEYERTGSIPTSEPHAQFSVFTNSVIVAGVSYRCALALDWRYFSGEGFLAVSTNRTILWIDKVRPPRIIDDQYRAPIFRHGV
jgi:hypothetical protein